MARYWQNPVNWQPIAPPFALSRQHTMFFEQHLVVPSGHAANACCESEHAPPLLPPLLLPPLLLPLLLPPLLLPPLLEPVP